MWNFLLYVHTAGQKLSFYSLLLNLIVYSVHTVLAELCQVWPMFLMVTVLQYFCWRKTYYRTIVLSNLTTSREWGLLLQSSIQLIATPIHSCTSAKALNVGLCELMNLLTNLKILWKLCWWFYNYSLKKDICSHLVLPCIIDLVLNTGAMV